MLNSTPFDFFHVLSRTLSLGITAVGVIELWRFFN
jgi:hypothetical protein